MQQHITDIPSREYKSSEDKGATDFEAVTLQRLDGLLCSFLDDFRTLFKTRTSSTFQQAQQFSKGLVQTFKRRNIERIQEEVPLTDYDQLHHFISVSPWDDRDLVQEIARRANHSIGGSYRTGLIIDPSCFPKKGKQSVGVSRMWCGRLGKVDNCQKGVFAALGKGKHACLIDKLLYLPEDWTTDPDRCDKAKIPQDERIYQSSQELALKLIDNADSNGVRYAWLGMDAEFAKPWLIQELSRRNKEIMIDIPCDFPIFHSHPQLTKKPALPADSPLKKLRFAAKSLPVGKWVDSLPGKRWRSLKIRDCSKGILEVSVFNRTLWWWPKEEEPGKTRPKPMRMRLIVRRVPSEKAEDGYDYRYSLSNASPRTTVKRLAYQQAQRFWVEQSIKDCKQDAGMAQYQVRCWRGWHHHVSMSILVGLFMMEMRLKFGEDIPLLSVSDIRELLTSLLPAKNSFGERIQQMKKRHRQREVKRKPNPG